MKDRKRYFHFNIKKGSGADRFISAPPKNLAILQSKLLRVLSLVYSPKPCVHGFCKKRSILTNASTHTQQRYVLNVDLKDFFPSIHIGRVIGVFGNQPFSLGDEAAEVLAQICTMDDGVLPQGAPTSPIISNLVCRSLDTDLMNLARKHQCTCTRYADDITFSTSRSAFPREVATVVDGHVTLGKSMLKVIRSNSFDIRNGKSRLHRATRRQKVTGLTVNEFPNISRQTMRGVRAALRSWRRFGYDEAQAVYLAKYHGDFGQAATLDAAIRGHLAFIKMVRGANDPLFRRMVVEYNYLRPEKPIRAGDVQETEPSPLRGGYPKHDIWSKWARRFEKGLVLLELKNDAGDVHVATAFHVGNGLLATAGHNLALEIDKVWAGDRELQVLGTDSLFEKKVDVGIIRVAPEPPIEMPSFPCHFRIPEVGEEVAALGFPVLPQRRECFVLSAGIVEALPVNYNAELRFIQVSFQSGGGMSGAPLIDKRGNAIGVMVENIFQEVARNVPDKPFGQAVPVEYAAQLIMPYLE